ncbi:MAG: BCD family MFS transporter [Myxococcota bacterium]
MNQARKPRSAADFWRSLGPKALPFADAASAELPLGRLLRLSLFQVSTGLSLVLLNGTLNRVMIVELGIPVWLVSALVALPILFAPLRALIGHRSDNHRSVFGWRRVPYIWMGSLIQFGGFAIMPFALLVLSGTGQNTIPGIGEAASGVAFLLVGAGMHTVQTAGVALATDIAPKESQPRVVALLYVMLLVGMMAASLLIGGLLRDFGYSRLVQVVQGAAVITFFLNLVALWQQEPRRRKTKEEAEKEEPDVPFLQSLRVLTRDRSTRRLLVAVGLGGAGFSMQDILLEPYGGELLNLSVSETTVLTALMCGGTLAGLYFAARSLSKSGKPYRLAAFGTLIGIVGFTAVVFAAPLTSVAIFWVGTVVIGFGSGWFSVGTLIASMDLSEEGRSGIAIGAWGAVQATVAGAGIALGGAIRDGITSLATAGSLGPGLTSSAVGYSFVYHLEIFLLFGTLVAIGPLVRSGERAPSTRFGLAELPS